MEQYATIDSSGFPKVIISFKGNKADDANFTTYLEKTKALYDKKQKLSITFDATHATIPALKYQKQQADWLKDNRALMEDYCKGTAYVIPNPIIRNVLKAIFALQKQPVPYKTVSSLDEAAAWVKTL
ncbi:MAG: STAS/SEC14 domain-containing protein [Bacteroidota bacterium]